MFVRVQRLPGQPHALPGNVTSSHHVLLWKPVTWHVVMLAGFHPCSVTNGTGKLNINIIYSKCHKCKVGLVLVLFYDFGDAFCNLRLPRPILKFCLYFSEFYTEIFGTDIQKVYNSNCTQIQDNLAKCNTVTVLPTWSQRWTIVGRQWTIVGF